MTFYSLYHHSYQYLCDCSYQFSLTIIHNHYLQMENQRSILCANFDLVNTYFSIDVGHTYDGIDVTALMSYTLSAQKDIHDDDRDLFLQIDKRVNVSAMFTVVTLGPVAC